MGGRSGTDPTEPERNRVPIAALLPTAARHDHDHDHDDDHDEEDAEVDACASFSLIERLTASPSPLLQGDPTHVEIISINAGRITDVTLLAPGDAYYLGCASGRARRLGLRPRVPLIRLRKDSRCILTPPTEMTGTVRRGAQSKPLDAVTEAGRRGRVALLGRKDAAELTLEKVTFHVRYVRAPMLAKDERPWRQRLRPDKVIGRSFMGSAGGHLSILLVGLFMPAQPVAPPAQQESFAEVQLNNKEVKLEEPVVEPPKEPEPEPAPAAASEKPVPKSMQAAPTKRPKAGGTSSAPPGVLGLLSKRGSSAAPGPAAALAAVSNLSAAAAPAGASGFRVSGLVGKLATSDIMIGGGGGGLVTKGGTALLRGGGGGAGALSGKGTRGVGGIVQKVPQEMRSVGQGSLDRDAIQKVINQNVSQIQRCYERELVNNPGLSGKIEVEWTVMLSGSVKSTRQKFNTLSSPAAVSCILDKIKTWRFPNPKGGEVIVSYPFVFKSISY